MEERASPSPGKVQLRWHQYAAEARVNLLRVLAILAFYGIHWWHYSSASAERFPAWLVGDVAAAPSLEVHQALTLVAVAWLAGALAVHLILQRPWFPWWLKYAATCTDLAALTGMLFLVRGPLSPLVVAYFVILALSGLRMDLWLVRFATCGCVMGYLAVLASARWELTAGDYRLPATVPRYHQAIFLLALLFTGVAIGQIVRQSQHVTASFIPERKRET